MNTETAHNETVSLNPPREVRGKYRFLAVERVVTYWGITPEGRRVSLSGAVYQQIKDGEPA